MLRDEWMGYLQTGPFLDHLTVITIIINMKCWRQLSHINNVSPGRSQPSSTNIEAYHCEVNKHQATRKGWCKVGPHQQPLLINVCQPAAVPENHRKPTYKNPLPLSFLCAKYCGKTCPKIYLIINIWRKAEILKEPIQRPREAIRACTKKIEDRRTTTARLWSMETSQEDFRYTTKKLKEGRLQKDYKTSTEARP